MYETQTSPGEVGLGGLQLDEMMLLEAEDTTWQPTEAGGLEGHHARTTVRFAIPSRPESFVLEIRDVPDVPVRRLAWPAIVQSADSPETSSGL